MKNRSLSTNEDGSVMVVSLMMLVLLTIIGVSAITTSNVELQISGNERVHRENLYNAEGSGMHAAQVMQDTDLVNNSFAWLKEVDDPFDESTDIPDDNYWDNTNSQSSASANTRFSAVSEGVVSGDSLDMSVSTVHSYIIYGRSNQKNGLVVVKLGYRKPF
jgi:Tfp pilus assembly protein PilX